MELPLFDKSKFPWVADNSVSFNTGDHYPKVSVVVPSYNQGYYIEETLLSIINQNYPNLELIVIDGGSTDNSVEIIKTYEKYIYYWVSEKDKGQSDAINKGFKKATGEWIAWMNSDDCYLSGAFYYISQYLNDSKFDFLYGNCTIGSSFTLRKESIVPNNRRNTSFNLLLFFVSTQYMIPSQSVFVRRSLLEKAGLLDESCNFVMDMEWYVRLYKQTTKRLDYKKCISFFRINPGTKTGSSNEKMLSEAKEVAKKHANSLNIFEKHILLCALKESEGFNERFDLFKKSDLKELIFILFKYPVTSILNVHFLSRLKASIKS